jgi:hypothetical protein
MATHTQKGGVTVDAFQWPGGTLATAAPTLLPVWAKQLALHSPGDGTLDVPTPRGTFAAKPTDWIVRASTGDVSILSAAQFGVLYA